MASVVVVVRESLVLEVDICHSRSIHDRICALRAVLVLASGESLELHHILRQCPGLI